LTISSHTFALQSAAEGHGRGEADVWSSQAGGEGWSRALPGGPLRIPDGTCSFAYG